MTKKLFKLSFHKKVNLGFFIAVLVIILFSFYVIHISNEWLYVKDLNLKIYEVEAKLHEIASQTRELEILRRDYSLSKKVMYLEAYYYHLVKIQESLQQPYLEEYFKDNEKAKANILKIVQKIGKTLECPSSCKYDPNQKNYIHEIIKQHFNSTEIETFAQELRNEIEAIATDERFHLKTKQEEEVEYLKLINRFIILGSIISTLFLIVLVYLVNKDIITDRLHVAELRLLSMTDELTGLNNRRGFIHEAKIKFQEAIKHKRKMFLYFIDMDGLKTINDTLGHEYGDRAIKALSEILKQSFRLSDIIARLGGDEFTVLMVDEHVTPNIIQQRLQKKINEFNKNNNEPFKLSISIGFKEFNPENPTSIEDMLHEADKKMYQQKQLRKSHN